MNHTTGFNYVPRNYAHTHFYDYIESFPGLEVSDSMASEQSNTVAKLRHQYLNEDQSENKICLRNCFKRKVRSEVELCLSLNCQGADFFKSADLLGYLKKPTA